VAPRRSAPLHSPRREGDEEFRDDTGRGDGRRRNGERRDRPTRSRRDRRRRAAVARSRGQRIRRRLLLSFGSLLGIAVLLAAGLFAYGRWRFDQIAKVGVNGLAERVANEPFDVLFIGSDSRSFATTKLDSSAYGSSSSVGGQRSDVIIVARISPATHQVKLLSIPRDTYVDIPGTSDIAGPNRINAAFNSGPSLLVQTITNAFHLPVSNVVEVNFPGLQNMVDAVGGIYLNFPDPVRDLNSHLGITRTGCHLVFGSQALALVRSRDLSYETGGVWHYDGLGDLSRIQRQDAFFRALLPRLRDVVGSPTRLNSLLGAATKNLIFDKSLTEGELLSLAQLFHAMGSSGLSTETLPTIPWTTPGGADVLLPAASADEQMINQFISFGTPHATLTAALTGPTPATLTAAGDSGAVTVTTVPSSASGADVATNTQKEPWNPYPCAP